MNRREFGKLITALRRERLDNLFKPWTREQFLEECKKLPEGNKMDWETLSNIENGRRVHLPPDLLVLLADALKLTSGERKEFFLAASGVDESSIYQQYDNTKKVLKDLISNMDGLQFPAFIADHYWDVVAINQALIEIYDLKPENFGDPNANSHVAQFNMMRILFSPEFEKQKELLGDDWEKFASNTAILFRILTLRYRATEYFQSLYPELCKYDDFKTYIHRQIKPKDDYFIDNMYITLNNPRYGLIQTITTSLTAATPSGELALSVFTPLNKETIEIFTDICKQGNQVFTILPDWPAKNI